MRISQAALGIDGEAEEEVWHCERLRTVQSQGASAASVRAVEPILTVVSYCSKTFARCSQAVQRKLVIISFRMSSAPQPAPASPRRDDLSTKVHQFWRRVTDGLEINQLWGQFQTEARASYRLYSRDVDSTRREGVRP